MYFASKQCFQWVVSFQIHISIKHLPVSQRNKNHYIGHTKSGTLRDCLLHLVQTIIFGHQFIIGNYCKCISLKLLHRKFNFFSKSTIYQSVISKFVTLNLNGLLASKCFIRICRYFFILIGE